MNYKNYKTVKIGRFGTLAPGGVQTARRAANRHTHRRDDVRRTARCHHHVSPTHIHTHIAQIRTPRHRLGKQDGAKHRKHAPKIITQITNNYKPKSGAIGQAKRFELQKLQNCQNRPNWDFDAQRRPGDTTRGEPPHTLTSRRAVCTWKPS